VLVEPRIILNAPAEYLLAGIGDTLAKWYEAVVLGSASTVSLLSSSTSRIASAPLIPSRTVSGRASGCGASTTASYHLAKVSPMPASRYSAGALSAAGD
jgi:hypothetical protein